MFKKGANIVQIKIAHFIWRNSCINFDRTNQVLNQDIKRSENYQCEFSENLVDNLGKFE